VCLGQRAWANVQLYWAESREPWIFFRLWGIVFPPRLGYYQGGKGSLDAHKISAVRAKKTPLYTVG